MIFLAEALLAASTNKRSSKRFSVGGIVDCIRNTSCPLTVSSNEGWNSPSLKTVTLTSPSFPPKFSAILFANFKDALPENIFTPTFFLNKVAKLRFLFFIKKS